MAKSKCKISCIFVEKNTKFSSFYTQNLFDLYATLCKISTEPILKKINGKNIISILITDDLAYQLQNTPMRFFGIKTINYFASYIRASGLNVLRTSHGTYLNHPLTKITIHLTFSKKIFFDFFHG